MMEMSVISEHLASSIDSTTQNMHAIQLVIDQQAIGVEYILDIIKDITDRQMHVKETVDNLNIFDI